MKEVNHQLCDRADDLVSFLYRELNEQETRRFEQHLGTCFNCKNELASFGGIRNSIISWRDESLGSSKVSAATSNGHIAGAEARLSAMMAIRNFLSVSPLWLKSATVFASLLFCVCAVMSIAYMKGRQSRTVVATDKLYSQSEVDQQVAAATQMKEMQMRSLENQKPSPTITVDNVVNKPAPKIGTSRTGNYAVDTHSLRKPLTREERRELAADLGLTVRDDDDADFVTDKITQNP